MDSLVAPSRSRNAGGDSRGFKQYTSFCAAEYGADYTIPLLPYQQRGVLARELWATRNHIFRIIPGYDQETGEVYRQNCHTNEYSEEEDPRKYLSNTFTECSVMSQLGDNNLVVADYAPNSDAFNTYGADTVFRCFSGTIYNSVKAETSNKKVFCKGIPEWRAWTAMQGNLPLPRRALLMQTLATTINGRVFSTAAARKDGDSHEDLLDESGAPSPMLTVLAVTQKESVKNMLQALVEPQYPSKPLDALTNNKYGGFAELDGIVMYLNSVTNSDGKHYLKPSVQPAGQGWTPTPFPLSEAQVKGLWIPWTKLLHFLTPEEQLELLVVPFGADTVNYVCGLDPRLEDLVIPSNIWKAGFGRYIDLVDMRKAQHRISIQGGEAVTVRTVAATPAPAAAPAATPTPVAVSLGAALFPPQPRVVAPAAATVTSAVKPATKLGVPAKATVPAKQAEDIIDSSMEYELKRMRSAGLSLPEDESEDVMDTLLGDDPADEIPM